MIKEKLYKCISEMVIEKYDEHCFPTGEFEIVPVGSIWYEDDAQIIGGEVHLECKSGADEFGWIEITKKHLERHFAPLN